jgi:hypothetical protein
MAKRNAFLNSATKLVKPTYFGFLPQEKGFLFAG